MKLEHIATMWQEEKETLEILKKQEAENAAFMAELDKEIKKLQEKAER